MPRQANKASAHLDLTGRIPTRARVVAFLADSDPYKRAKLIDELLASPDFGRHLARIWADMLIKRDFDTNKNIRPTAFVTWMAEQIPGSELLVIPAGTHVAPIEQPELVGSRIKAFVERAAAG